MTYRGLFMSGLPDPSGPAGATSSKVPPAVEAGLPNGGKGLIQVNFCKNPRCDNYGVAARLPRYARRAKAGSVPGSAYTIAASGKGLPMLHCRLCGEMPPMKIDRFFMPVRRRLSLLKRPIGTASKAGRTWYGYSAYRPAHIEKLLGIFRVYYNYALKGGDGKTPAMRLGLETHIVKFDELLGVHEVRKSPSESRVGRTGMTRREQKNRT